MLRTTIISAALSLTAAQDPAGGWMAYAVGTVPAETTRITRMQMTWKVGENPTTSSGAFYSPWFGMDPSDNLNLIQPVNPWVGRGWAMYTEYFQWSPEDNSNSEQNDVEAGQTLQGQTKQILEKREREGRGRRDGDFPKKKKKKNARSFFIVLLPFQHLPMRQ